MPLTKSKSPKAFQENIKREIAAGKPQKQAVAIAYDVQRRAKKADGGDVTSAPKRFSETGPFTIVNRKTGKVVGKASTVQGARRSKDRNDNEYGGYIHQIMNSKGESGFKNGGGLYANIHAKRKRIAEGSGEKMRKPGSAGAPTAKAFKQSARTAKKAGGGDVDYRDGSEHTPGYEPIDYTKPDPNMVIDKYGNKLEYGVPVNEKGKFKRPESEQFYSGNMDYDDYKARKIAYGKWQDDYKRRWPDATFDSEGKVVPKVGLAPYRFETKKKKGGGVSLSVKRGEKLPVSKGAGLTAKGRAKYNRETGSELKAPQPEGGARKKSFCARMSGVVKHSKGDAERAKASLRRWKCSGW